MWLHFNRGEKNETRELSKICSILDRDMCKRGIIHGKGTYEVSESGGCNEKALPRKWHLRKYQEKTK